MTSLFGTSGIRGPAKDFLNNQFCFDIGRTFAIFLSKSGQKGKVAVGRDTRLSSSRIKNAFSSGVQRENYEVLDQGIVPSPAMNYILIADPSYTGSCMITGSHIRSDFNGLKFFAFREEILKKHEKEIEKIYNKIKGRIPYKVSATKTKKVDEALHYYRQMLLNLADTPFPQWKIVVDASNGCQSKIIPEILKKLGLEVKTINCDPKPEKFIARDTETGEAVKDLQKKVKSEKADLGIAFDGDGDRVVFVDEKGNFFPGDYSGSLIAKYNQAKIIVTPVNTSQVIEKIGKKVIRTKVGSPYVVEMMKKRNASFGFEANGGGFSSEVMLSRDGGSVTIKILNLLKEKRKSLGKLMNALPRFFLYRTKVDCPTELNSTIIKEARNKFKGVKVETIDGLKIWRDSSSWILFRPSSNAPEFRVFVEAKTEKEAEDLGKEGIAFVKSFIEQIT
jgi:phosphomannomutase/phosphoglucomutase